jgi:dienelactone hydrolase
MRAVCVLTEDCPLGCGPVIFVKSVASKRVFAWCVGCGLAWAAPENETWELGDHGHAEIHASLVADGSIIEAASKEEIRAAKFDHLIALERSDDAWLSECIERYNAAYGTDPGIVDRARNVSEQLREIKKRQG